jgi:hypothetical protein
LNADANKLLGELGHLGILTDNLPVEIAARHSPFAAEDKEEGFLVRAGQPLALSVTVHPGNLALDLLRRDAVGTCPGAAASGHAQ